MTARTTASGADPGRVFTDSDRDRLCALSTVGALDPERMELFGSGVLACEHHRSHLEGRHQT